MPARTRSRRSAAIDVLLVVTVLSLGGCVTTSGPAGLDAADSAPDRLIAAAAPELAERLVFGAGRVWVLDRLDPGLVVGLRDVQAIRDRSREDLPGPDPLGLVARDAIRASVGGQELHFVAPFVTSSDGRCAPLEEGMTFVSLVILRGMAAHGDAYLVGATALTGCSLRKVAVVLGWQSGTGVSPGWQVVDFVEGSLVTG